MQPRGWVSNALRMVSCAIALHSVAVEAIDLDVNSTDSIKSTASIIAADMLTWYTGNKPGGTVGLLPTSPAPPYYWWEAGAMFGSLIDYWYYTGDSQYNNLTITGLQSQVGTAENFEPSSQSFDLGNDDQAFWGMAALSAAELNFPDPPEGQPAWLTLAQAVFNRQAMRWDNATCNGGLRWQIFQFNGGYDYKNAISNGCFFNIAARLGKYTNNQTYIDWATATWDWSVGIGLIDEKYNVYDGTSVGDNCSAIQYLQWSYNVGVYLLGAATMWNVTGEDIWYNRTQSLLDATHVFYTNNTEGTIDHIMWEIECEPRMNCNNDQKSFKAYLSRWMAATTKVAPWTYNYVWARLVPTAQQAALSCQGSPSGSSGSFCGLKWTIGGWDGTTGVGQQMNALEAVQSLLIAAVKAPVTSTTGGTSQGDPSAGSMSTDTDPEVSGIYYDITQGDKAGAGILTVLLASITIGGAAWMIW